MTTLSNQVESLALSAVEREQQRVRHLVLGQPRPSIKVIQGKRNGRRKPVIRDVPMPLEPSVEREMQLRERWSHKTHGTPQTHEHAARAQEGSMLRLWLSEAINAEQLAAAVDIATVAHRIGADVAVKTASLETRVDSTPIGNGTFFELIGQVRREMAYGRWRAALRGPIAPVLEMIVGDVGLTIVAKQYRMHNRRAKKLLIDALDLWPRILGKVYDEVDEATLLAAHAGILG